MSVTFNIPQDATRTVRHQEYQRLALSLGTPPQVAKKIYKGQNLDNIEICKLYTHAYNVYLINMLTNDNIPEGMPLGTLETTERLERIYNSKMRFGELEADRMLRISTASNYLPHFLMALHLEPKPHSYELNSSLKKALISQFNQPTDEKKRMIKALLKNGARLYSDFGYTILNHLCRSKRNDNIVNSFDLPLFKWVVSLTKESFFLHNLRDFLAQDHCSSSDELLDTAKFFLQHLQEYPPTPLSVQRQEYYDYILKSLSEKYKDSKTTEEIQEMAHNETEQMHAQERCDAEAKDRIDQVITQTVENCLNFKNSDDLLGLLREANFQGDCSYNLVQMLKAVDKGVIIAPELAQFFSGDTAQERLEFLIYLYEEKGAPSQHCLDLLTTCGASIDEKNIINLLENERPDEVVAFALQIMTEKPTERSLETAFHLKRFHALQLIIQAGAVSSEDLVRRVIQSSIRGEKPDLELLTLLVKSGAPISADTWQSAQAWDKMKGWDLEQTLINAVPTIPDELA